MNEGLHKAKRKKKDEFYTLYSDIETELQHYDFSGKTVYCNCDDGMRSNFFLYFMRNFEKLKLRKLICTGIGEDIDRVFVMYKKDYALFKPHDGDFRNNIDLLINSDIVVTNPPFSLFREFMKVLMEYKKKFLVIGSIPQIGYKEIFPLIQNNQVWFGYRNFGCMRFMFGNEIVKVKNICWFTNLCNDRHNYLDLKECYDSLKYPKYDNYNAINVDKVCDIPCDYCGTIGVPISFFNKYNPKQFEIVGFRKGNDGDDLHYNGKYPFTRVLIKRKNN